MCDYDTCVRVCVRMCAFGACVCVRLLLYLIRLINGLTNFDEIL